MSEKSELFDKEMKALFAQSLEILNKFKKVKETELDCLNKFISIYKKLTPPEFYIYFENLWKKHKTLILKSDDDWLKEDVVIQLGDHREELKHKFVHHKIMVSIIYASALKLKKVADDTLKDLSDEYRQDKDLIRPDILLLHLLRLFYITTNEKDLEPLIQELETKLKVTNKLITASPVDLNASLDAFVNTISNTMKQSGINLPDNIQIPTASQLIETINSVMNNPGIKSMVSGLTESIKNNDELAPSLESLFKSMTSTDSINTFKDTIAKTAEIAKENSI